jgi:peptidoglycan/LPS O-acetylase OafA/YrhL
VRIAEQHTIQIVADVASHKPELRALTGLRFLAAFHVLVFHTLFTFSRSALLLPRGTLRSLLSSGYVGVNLFFVLSGFVLAYAYVEDGRMAATAGRFWRARFARVYPLHLLGVLAALPLFVLGSSAAHATSAAIAKEGATELGLSALLVQAWMPAHVLDLNGPSWSLSVEAFFYAMFPLLVRLLGPLRGRGLVVAAAAAWGAALAPPLLHHGPANVLAPASALDHVLLYNPLVRLPDFIVGMATGLLFLRSARSWSRAPVIATATFVLILALLATSDRLPFAMLHNGLLDPLWALLLYALAMASGKHGARGIGSDPLVRGGEASYALYVLHKPLYFWLARVFQIGLLPPAGFIAAFLGGSVALAVIARRYVEEPLRRLLMRQPRSG